MAINPMRMSGFCRWPVNDSHKWCLYEGCVCKCHKEEREQRIIPQS